MITCPICNQGNLVEAEHDLLLDSGIEVNSLKHSICDYCEEWIVTPEQSRENKLKILNEDIINAE